MAFSRPDVTARVSVEMGSVIGWDRYVGAAGAKIGMHTFGSSAPLKDLLQTFGFTPAGRACRSEGADRKVRKEGNVMKPRRQNEELPPEPASSQLHDHGQAIWLDFLSRRFIAEGGLQKLIDNGWADRRYFQSLHLRKGHRRQRRLRCVAEGR